MKKYYKILIPIVCIAIIVSVCLCIFGKNEQKVEVTEKQEFLINYLEKISNTLKLNSTDKYEEVGVYENETLYAFSQIPNIEFRKRFTVDATETFLKNEMSIREFYSLKNNIVFTNTEEQQEKRKLLGEEITEIKELQYFEVMDNIPEFGISIEKYQAEENVQNITFYRTDYVSADNKYVIEAIYMMGEKAEGFVLIDSVYFVNGEKTNPTRILRPENIAGFTPVTFEEETPSVDLGNQDAIIDREENYQGSKPYYEQNFEENDKVFNKN